MLAGQPLSSAPPSPPRASGGEALAGAISHMRWLAVVAGPVRVMAASHADAVRSVPAVGAAHAHAMPCGTPRAAVVADDSVRADVLM